MPIPFAENFKLTIHSRMSEGQTFTEGCRNQGRLGETMDHEATRSNRAFVHSPPIFGRS